MKFSIFLFAVRIYINLSLLFLIYTLSLDFNFMCALNTIAHAFKTDIVRLRAQRPRF